MPDTRSLPVPDGLDGMRVDAGLARLLGLSRTVVAALAEDGRVEVDGRSAGKSDRLTAGAWLEVALPDPEPPAPITGSAMKAATVSGPSARINCSSASAQRVAKSSMLSPGLALR